MISAWWILDVALSLELKHYARNSKDHIQAMKKTSANSMMDYIVQIKSLA